MKSKMKKLVSLVLAMAMVFTMSAVAYAEETTATTYTITINNTTDGHTYEAYKIFSGDLSGTTLSNITWGTGVTDTDNLLAAIKAISISESSLGTAFASCSSAADVAKVLSDNSSNSELATTFADVVSKYLATTATGSTNSLIAASGTEGEENYVAAHYEITNLSAGYYLVKDKDGTLSGSSDAYTDYILKVVADTSVTPKSGTPTVVKKVKETNDTTGVTTGWQDAADYDIGDVIPYQLTGTLPQKLSTYTVYQYVFTDTLSAGLTVMKADKETEAAVTDSESNAIETKDVTVTVYADSDDEIGTVVATGYTVTLTSVTDAKETDTYYGGTILTVSIADVNKLYASDSDTLISVTEDSTIVVTYNAKLNSKAVIGSAGNPNEVVLTYSNNPNDTTGGGTGTTPEDKVTVFTFELDVNKVNGSNKALKGAGFTLYKFDKNANDYVAVGSEVSGSEMTTFVFKGLDTGKYKLVETTTPDGYNTADPVYFQIVAEYDTDATNPSLTSLTVKSEDGNTTLSTGAEGASFTAVVNTGLVSTTVVNNSGSVLPSTGGIGTTIFYIVGAILVLGAGVVLVTRRRTAR